jgi:hypothetical protein
MRALVMLGALVACSPGVDLASPDSGMSSSPDSSAGGSADAPTAGATKSVAITPGDTSTPELVKFVPVGTSEANAQKRIALHLTPEDLPDLASGDRLIVPVELQLTTRCDIGQTAAGCNYNPTATVKLVITGDANGTGGSNSKVIATETLSCTKAEHHCMFVFTPGAATLALDESIPCVATDSCYVNVVVSAWDAAARPGGQDVMLVGGNDGDFLLNGQVEQDIARIMAVRERGIEMADRAVTETSGTGTQSINLSAAAELVYSQRLKPAGMSLEAGEQYIIEAKIVASVTNRARFSSKLFLTHNASEVEGDGIPGVTPGSISEHNGQNCVDDNNCTTHKVAVFKVDQTIAEPVFVNIFVKSEVPGGGAASVTVKKADGFMRSIRYGAPLSK